MRHLDLSFEGKHLAEKNQLDNGKLPHGGYRGSKKHPPSHLSYDKGREFQQRLEEELSKIMEVDDMAKHGSSPSWSILVHNSPSYTDESPLITNNLLAASKLAQINGISMYNRTSLLPNKCPRPAKPEGVAYYRPNRMHQYLSATELKNSASEDVNILYGRPTRTTLLRARQRSNSAPSNQLEKKRDFVQRLDDIKTAPAGALSSSEYLQLQSVRDGESLHSYLTGARYNRAHCLDSKSVEHNGVYMPRHNPALGSFFTGPKGQEYLQEMGDSPRQDLPSPPSPRMTKRRPLTAPSYGRRTGYMPGPAPLRPDQPGSSKYKYLKLNIVGSRLPLVNTREPQQPMGLRLPKLPETVNFSDRRLEEALDQTYLVNQPMPSPSGEASPFSKQSRVDVDQTIRDTGDPGRLREELSGVGAIRIEGRSTFKVKGHEAEIPVSVPVVSAEDHNKPEVEKKVDEREEEEKEEEEEEDHRQAEEKERGEEDDTKHAEAADHQEVTLQEPDHAEKVEEVVTVEQQGEPAQEEEEVLEQSAQEDEQQKEEIVEPVEEVDTAGEKVEDTAEPVETEPEPTHEETEQRAVEDDEEAVKVEEKEEVEGEEKPEDHIDDVKEVEENSKEEEVVEEEAPRDSDTQEDAAEAERSSQKEVRFFITENGNVDSTEIRDTSHTAAIEDKEEEEDREDLS